MTQPQGTRSQRQGTPYVGWEDCHLHEFRIGHRLYSIPDADDDLYERKVIDERQQQLLILLPRVGTAFQYLYDFGDSRHHNLLLEAILLPDSAQHYPCCITGERRCPPEDVGGTTGFKEYLQALADPKHEEHENWLRWRGRLIPTHSRSPTSTSNSGSDSNLGESKNTLNNPTGFRNVRLYAALPKAHDDS